MRNKQYQNPLSFLMFYHSAKVSGLNWCRYLRSIIKLLEYYIKYEKFISADELLVFLLIDVSKNH